MNTEANARCQVPEAGGGQRRRTEGGGAGEPDEREESEKEPVVKGNNAVRVTKGGLPRPAAQRKMQTAATQRAEPLQTPGRTGETE